LTPKPSSLSRGGFIGAAAAALAAPQLTRAAGSSIYYGVSGPFSGDRAAYGEVWKKGMSLAVDEINAAGGIKGRPLALVFADSQSDPKQSVPVAQSFVDDPRIIAELGDFSSPASMAASPIYERGKLVQFGFTNSDPKFTQSGEYMFSTAVTMQRDAALLAEVTYRRLGKRAAVLYQDTDWGQTTHDIFVKHFTELGGQIVSSENYLPTDKDYHAILSKTRATNPDVLVLFSYYTDGALLLQQAADVGLHAKTIAAGSCYSNQFLELGGGAVNGTVLTVLFFPDEPRPEIQRLVGAYVKRYGEKPDQYAARAYDAVKILAWATEHGGPDREGVRHGLLTGKGIPSVLNGPFAFGLDRRVESPTETIIAVSDGKFVSFR
jgi:branched-chain amino acid transport system substrate-binding protein